MIIKNTQQLLAHGNAAGRQVVLDILEAGLQAPDPYPNLRKLVRVEGGKLIIGAGPEFIETAPNEPLVFDLSQVGHIYVVGGGKAVPRLAQALEDALGDLITDGQINGKKGDTIRLKRIPLILAGHPLPDEDSERGGRRMLEIESRARKGDIVFVLDSGGGTATTATPAPGITIADLRQVFKVLYFDAGANMPAANAVRNHLTLVNTKHARYTGDATLIQISSREFPPHVRPHLYEAPRGATGHEAAIQVLRYYNCWDKVPQSVRDFLLRADPQYGPVTAEEVRGKPHYHYRVMGPEYMLAAARRRAEELGLRVLAPAQSLNDIETRPVAEAMAHIASECETAGLPLQPPCVFLSGGELVVAVGEATGCGGRNTEFALAAAPHIAGSPNIVVASVDSEGSDGPTDFAGGMTDGLTMRRLAEDGLDFAGEMANHNSGGVLERLNDVIVTGLLGQNVRDLRVIYVGGTAG